MIAFTNKICTALFGSSAAPFKEEAELSVQENLKMHANSSVYIDRDGNAHLNIFNKDVQDKIQAHINALKDTK